MKTVLSENALKVAESRYFMEDENWDDCSRRVANTAGMIEGEKHKYWSDIFHEMIHNLDFLPAGRILRNSGRIRGSLFNCYHLPVGDSIEEIGQMIKDALILWSDGGGVGINFSSLRPKGDEIKGKGGFSSGLVSFIEATDAIAATVESGGSRRAAAIAHVDISHPEVEDFIDSKLSHGKLSYFNISVSITNDFIATVEADGDWEFKFQQKSYGKVKARKLWDKIISNMIKCGEPGLINWDNLSKNNSYSFAPILGTNPCLSGDTKVAVADGRGDVPIKTLAEEGKDIPVYCKNEKTGELEIQMMRNPRITGYSQKMLKIKLDDSSVVRCTENHKFIMHDGSIKEAKDLKSNDRLHHMVKKPDCNGHLSFKNGFGGEKPEHRMIYKFNNPDKVGGVIHHKNNDKWDNRINNLMRFESHSNYKKYLLLKKTTDLDIFFEDNIIKVNKICEHCDSIFVKNWTNREISFCSVSCCNKSIRHRNKQREFAKKNRLLKIADLYVNLEKDLGRDPLRFELEKLCKINRVSFELSGKLTDTQYLGHLKDIKNYVKEVHVGNYKVDTVEEDGIDTVYNGTVDKHHNFYILTGKNKDTSNYINNLQCGEISLEAYGVCCLGSLKLTNFITGHKNTNWKKLASTVKLAVRFLDNIIDANKYSLEQININAHNSRRIGLGIMGVAEYLFAKNLRYGSEKATEELERTMKFIRDEAYKASIDLAIEKGAFPKFDPIAYGKASFVRKLPASIRMKIKDHGIRNCTLLTCAPTGTISLLAECSSGIEPLFSKGYIRKDRVSERTYVHPLYMEYVNKGEEIPDWFVDAYDLKPEDHFEVQAIAQKYIDSSVSKTINLPKETSEQELSKLLLTYLSDLKGTTIYRDGSREGQILNPISKEDIIKHIKDNDIQTNRDEGDIKCANGKCEM